MIDINVGHESEELDAFRPESERIEGDKYDRLRVTVLSFFVVVIVLFISTRNRKRVRDVMVGIRYRFGRLRSNYGIAILGVKIVIVCFLFLFLFFFGDCYLPPFWLFTNRSLAFKVPSH